MLALDMALNAAVRARGGETSPSAHFIIGDVRETLQRVPDGSIRCVVTSPPYFNLRDYGHEKQIGLEYLPSDYVQELVLVFQEVRRVLTDDGTVWLNIGDTYTPENRGENAKPRSLSTINIEKAGIHSDLPTKREQQQQFRSFGFKRKDRLMIPARAAIALQEDGWWLRDEIVWHKPRTTPHPVKDRTVAAHEMVYLLSKSERYFFDWAAIEEPAKYPGLTRSIRSAFRLQADPSTDMGKYGGRKVTVRDTRRARSVWSISPSPYKHAHFATMPIQLAEQCVKAGSAPGDWVLDPFGGVGTTALAARNLGRNSVSCELREDYAAMARKRFLE